MGRWEAQERARILIRDGSPGSEGLRVYRCRKCRGWHFTTKPQWPLWKKTLTRVLRAIGSRHA